MTFGVEARRLGPLCQALDATGWHLYPQPRLFHFPFVQNFLQVDTLVLEAEHDIQSQVMETLMAFSSSS